MKAFNEVAKQGKLTLGLVFPIEAYKGSIASMKDQEHLAQRAEALGFKALWFRDVPFNDPTFGDAGQLYDPWVYMTHIMNHTKNIALASGSVILSAASCAYRKIIGKPTTALKRTYFLGRGLWRPPQ